MEVNIPKTVKVNAKVMKLHIKVCNRFEGDLVDKDGDVLKSYEGYVPGFFPGQHYGDYLILDIDIDTGVILNWVTPEAEEIEQFVKGEEE